MTPETSPKRAESQSVPAQSTAAAPCAPAAEKPAPKLQGTAPHTGVSRHKNVSASEFCRAETEDDDGYDPWSDRRPDPEPLWEEDPWR